MAGRMRFPRIASRQLASAELQLKHKWPQMFRHVGPIRISIGIPLVCSKRFCHFCRFIMSGMSTKTVLGNSAETLSFVKYSDAQLYSQQDLFASETSEKSRHNALQPSPQAQNRTANQQPEVAQNNPKRVFPSCPKVLPSRPTCSTCPQATGKCRMGQAGGGAGCGHQDPAGSR